MGKDDTNEWLHAFIERRIFCICTGILAKRAKPAAAIVAGNVPGIVTRYGIMTMLFERSEVQEPASNNRMADGILATG
jgi:hypothetical protein